MRLIKLSKITNDRRHDAYNDTDDVGEANSAPAVVSQPVAINPEAIRCFYSRKNDAPGTRITFTDGGGFAVTELFEAVFELVNGSDAP